MKAEAVRAEYTKKLQELVLDRAAFETEKAKCLSTIKAEVEESKRREWEVKARLEITRQVDIEREKLGQMFKQEVDARVKMQVKQMREAEMVKLPSPPLTQPDSFQILGENETHTASEVSKLSLDSPAEDQVDPFKEKGTTPPRRKRRGPLGRSRTQMGRWSSKHCFPLAVKLSSLLCSMCLKLRPAVEPLLTEWPADSCAHRFSNGCHNG